MRTSKILPIFFLVGILLLAGCTLQGCTECEECPEELALMEADASTYHLAVGDPDSFWFPVYIYNYGGSEAKNVEVTCELYDRGITLEEDTFFLARDTTQGVGNIASHSRVYEEVTLYYPNSPDHYYSQFCFVSDCDNCEILATRIPEVKEELGL